MADISKKVVQVRNLAIDMISQANNPIAALEVADLFHSIFNAAQSNLAINVQKASEARENRADAVVAKLMQKASKKPAIKKEDSNLTKGLKTLLNLPDDQLVSGIRSINTPKDASGYKTEGFWWSKQLPNLPMPIAGKPFIGKKEFLAELVKKESKAAAAHYKGSSTCRICGKQNGSSALRTKDWLWPSGFRHYVESHNVRPSPEFAEFIMGGLDIVETRRYAAPKAPKKGKK